MSKIIVQDTWKEDNDIELLEYINMNHELIILSEDELLEIDNVDNYKCIFCDSDIFQQIFINIYKVYQCYPECFSKLYNRNIQVINSNELNRLQKPFFVKPYSNDKLFDGLIVNTEDEIESIAKNIKVYISSVSNFVNEYRIFIFNKKIYSIVDSSNFILHYSVSMPIPQDFINEITKVNIYDFCVIDIGYDKLIEKWSIVEVNPPFSLASYNLDISKYFEFCVNAYLYIKKCTDVK